MRRTHWAVVRIACVAALVPTCMGCNTGRRHDTLAVVSTGPADGASGVATGAAISVTFDRPLDPTTVTPLTFTLAGVSGSVSSNDDTATFRPDVALAPGTSYTATITTGMRAADGASLREHYSWTFTTVAASASGSSSGGSAGSTSAGGSGGRKPPPVSFGTPMAVVSTSPADGTSGVATNAAITITFDRAPDPTSTTPFTIMVTGVSGSVSCSGRTATFRPNAALPHGTIYAATVTVGVRDSQGSLPASFTWTFTTAQGPGDSPHRGVSHRVQGEAGLFFDQNVTDTSWGHIHLAYLAVDGTWHERVMDHMAPGTYFHVMRDLAYVPVGEPEPANAWDEVYSPAHGRKFWVAPTGETVAYRIFSDTAGNSVYAPYTFTYDIADLISNAVTRTGVISGP